jgi:hypothetical protein
MTHARETGLGGNDCGVHMYSAMPLALPHASSPSPPPLTSGLMEWGSTVTVAWKGCRGTL